MTYSTTRRNKNNAQRAQKKVAAAIAEAFQAKVVSPIYDGNDWDLRPKAMGLTGEDISISDALRKRFPYSVEVKYGQGFAAIEKAYTQCENNCPKNCDPLVVLHPKNSTKLYCVLDFNTLLNLIKDK